MVMEIAPHNFPEAPTGLWVILAGGTFQWGLVDQAPCRKSGEVGYVPCFATDSFRYFWKLSMKSYPDTFICKIIKLLTSRCLEPVSQEFFPSHYYWLAKSSSIRELLWLFFGHVLPANFFPRSSSKTPRCSAYSNINYVQLTISFSCGISNWNCNVAISNVSNSLLNQHCPWLKI